MQLNVLILEGTVRQVTVNKPRDPSKPASALVLLQYGPNRQSTSNATEFLNAVMIRIPAFRYPAIADRLVVGVRAQIHGHVQGVLKTALDMSHLSAELVADRVIIEGAKPAADAQPAADAPADAGDAPAAAPAAE